MGKSRAKAGPREASPPAIESRSRRPEWLVAGAVTLLCLTAYWWTRGTGPYWQELGSVPRGPEGRGGLLSPGYPVYLLLARPFVTLLRLVLPGATFAEAGNLFSSFAAALAAGLTSLSIATVLQAGYGFFGTGTTGSDRLGRGLQLLAAAVFGLLAGLSYSLWFQALTAEAYALNAFCAALVLHLALRAGGLAGLAGAERRLFHPQL